MRTWQLGDFEGLDHAPIVVVPDVHVPAVQVCQHPAVTHPVQVQASPAVQVVFAVLLWISAIVGMWTRKRKM